MEIIQNKYRSDSVRLRGWDYASSGYYFVTICTKAKEWDFGEIRNGVMGLSEVGCIAYQFWENILDHFSNVVLDSFVVMPNHVHGIVRIVEDGQCVNGVIRRDVALQRLYHYKMNGGKFSKMSEISPTKNSLSTIIRSYKSAVTYWSRKKGYPDFAWQPKFYDHIIQNQKELELIREYIRYNPVKWEKDLYF